MVTVRGIRSLAILAFGTLILSNVMSANAKVESESQRQFEGSIRYDYRVIDVEENALSMIWVAAEGDRYPLQWLFPGHSNGYQPSGCVNDWAQNEPAPSRFHFCLLTAEYNFVVPRELTPTLKSWTYDGWEYNLVASGQTFQTGQRIFNDVYVIAAPPEAGYYSRYHNRRMVSFYSKEFGLLGFQMQNISNDKKGPLWRLDGEIGVGAMPQEPLR